MAGIVSLELALGNEKPFTYDKTIEVFHRALNRATIDRTEKVKAFQRLARFDSANADLTAP